MFRRDAPPIQTVDESDAPPQWSRLLRLVSSKKTRVVVRQNGLAVAALVSMDDLEKLAGMDGETASITADTNMDELLDAALAANLAEAQSTHALLAPPRSAEIARRRAVAVRIRARRPYRVIAPLDAADLIHQSRAEEEAAFGQPR